jgi:hypothetical protein
MNDSFKNYSLKIFDELNRSVLKKFDDSESKEIENTINNIMKVEEIFNEIEYKMDSAVNKIVAMKINKEINNDLSFIN